MNPPADLRHFEIHLRQRQRDALVILAANLPDRPTVSAASDPKFILEAITKAYDDAWNQEPE